MYVDVIRTTKFEGINGPVDFTLPVAAGHRRVRSRTCTRSRSPAASGAKSEDPKYKYDMFICYGQDPNMPIQKKFEPITYA